MLNFFNGQNIAITDFITPKDYFDNAFQNNAFMSSLISFGVNQSLLGTYSPLAKERIHNQVEYFLQNLIKDMPKERKQEIQPTLIAFQKNVLKFDSDMIISERKILKNKDIQEQLSQDFHNLGRAYRKIYQEETKFKKKMNEIKKYTTS